MLLPRARPSASAATSAPQRNTLVRAANKNVNWSKKPHSNLPFANHTIKTSLSELCQPWATLELSSIWVSRRMSAISPSKSADVSRTIWNSTSKRPRRPSTTWPNVSKPPRTKRRSSASETWYLLMSLDSISVRLSSSSGLRLSLETSKSPSCSKLWSKSSLQRCLTLASAESVLKPPKWSLMAWERKSAAEFQRGTIIWKNSMQLLIRSKNEDYKRLICNSKMHNLNNRNIPLIRL